MGAQRSMKTHEKYLTLSSVYSGISSRCPEIQAYRLSFTACSLLSSYSADAIKLYVNIGDWEKVRQIALADNLVQARTFSSRKRITSELVLRLKMLNVQELDLFINATPQEQGYLLWLAICRCYGFVGDFAFEVIHENFINLKRIVSADDYNVFFQKKAEWHPELGKLADSTKNKLRQTLFLIMREAGILDKNKEILPACVSSQFRRHLASLDGRERMFLAIPFAWANKISNNNDEY